MPIAGSYLPESMLIKLSADVPLFELRAVESVKPAQERSEECAQESLDAPAVWRGFFFHEYLHFLHNISRASGIAALINQIELWRCFRLTMATDGFSQGSGGTVDGAFHHLPALSSYLNSIREDGAQSRLSGVMTPSRLDIVSVRVAEDVAGPTEIVLSKLICEATVYDHDGNDEQCVIEIKTQEIMECVAWCLEKRLTMGLNPDSSFNTPAVFPYRVVEAVARFMVPDIDEESVIRCALASMQSTDAPDALHQVLTLLLSDSPQTPESRQEVLRAMADRAGAESSGKLEAVFCDLEKEFSGSNQIAYAIRELISISRDALRLRLLDPFFEFKLVGDIISRPNSFLSLIAKTTPCAVLQERHGPKNQERRDFLISFRQGKTEDALRVLHAMFHFLRLHMTAGQGFVPTERINACCPYFTCCPGSVRAADPDVCLKTPWMTVDRNAGHGSASLCWYGAGVYITRPPIGVTSSRTMWPVNATVPICLSSASQ